MFFFYFSLCMRFPLQISLDVKKNLFETYAFYWKSNYFFLILNTKHFYFNLHTPRIYSIRTKLFLNFFIKNLKNFLFSTTFLNYKSSVFKFSKNQLIFNKNKLNKQKFKETKLPYLNLKFFFNKFIWNYFNIIFLRKEKLY